MLIKALTVDLQEMFCKQKGYLEEELDYRKQALDQAYMVKYCSIFSLFMKKQLLCWSVFRDIVVILLIFFECYKESGKCSSHFWCFCMIFNF